jgi:hypothetical protein
MIPVFGEPSLAPVTGGAQLGRRVAVDYGEIVQVAFAERGEARVRISGINRRSRRL